jgi:putative inorganic carbon (HCO3(-)) transporter
LTHCRNPVVCRSPERKSSEPQPLLAPARMEVRAGSVTATADLLGLRVKSLWRFFAAQGFVYWATCCYLFIEYVRPQSLIPALNNVPVGQIILGAALLAHVGSGRWFAIIGVGSWLLLLFTAVIVASSLTAYSIRAAVGQWRLWFSWLVVFFLIINVVNTEQRLAVFLLFWLLFHYYMSQGGARQWALRGFSFEAYGVVGAPGWFENSGEFGLAMGMFYSVAWRFYRAARPHLTWWWKVFVLGMPITAVLGTLGCSSRGAVLGLAAVWVWALLQGERRVKTVLGVAVLAVASWVVLPEGFKDRFRTIGTDRSSLQRRERWTNGLDMARTHPVLGVGYGNWQTYYEKYYRTGSMTLEESRLLSHNIFIECMSELGYVGLGVFVLLIFATLRMNYRTRRLASASRAPPHSFIIELAYGLDGALVSYLVCGYTVTVLYYPFFWINLAFTVALNAIAHRTCRQCAVTAGRNTLPMKRGAVQPQPARPR